MQHLTARWASLHTAVEDPVFVVTFLVSRRDNWSPDDYLGSAVSGFPVDLLGADVTRGSLCSIRLRFRAPDEETARRWGQDAMREVGRMAHFTDAFTLRRGRLTPQERRASVDDYGGYHQPSNPDEYGAWLHDLTEMIPEDVYTGHASFYTGFPQWLPEVERILQRTRNRPEERVTIYRALPTQYASFERGNWVTLSLPYARQHLESNVPGGHIVAAEVPAKQVSFGGDDLMEWGYWGPTIQGRPVT